MKKVNIAFKSGHTPTMELEEEVAHEMIQMMYDGMTVYKLPNMCIRLAEVDLIEIL